MADLGGILTAPDIGLTGGGATVTDQFGGIGTPDLSAILATLGLTPQPIIDTTIPPIDPSLLPPPLPPIDTTLQPPVIPPLPPPDLTGILPPVGLPPIGYDANGNPIYSVTTSPPVPVVIPPQPPTITQPPPVTVTQTSGGQGSALAIATASINQSIQIMNQDVTPLAQAVQQGIQQGAQNASDIAQSTTQAITQQLGTFTNGLFGWVKDFFSWLGSNIGNILQGIAKVAEDIAKVVYNVIKTVGESIVTWFQNTIGPVLQQVGDAIAKVADYYQKHIDPILRTISQVITITQSAIIAIEKDINAGIQGFLRLPGDLASAIGSIDQALIRAGMALRVHRAEDADFYNVTADGRGFADHIKSLGDYISGRTPLGEKTTFSPGALSLSEPTLAQELPALIDAMNTILFDLAKGLANIVKDPVKLVESLGIGGAATLLELAEPQELVRALWDVMKSPFDTIGELAAERVREIALLTKLDPSTLAAAWRRNFISQSDMDAELKVQGYNGTRSELLRRLTTHVEDVPTLVDLLYREIILDDDFVAGLHDLGYTDAQIGALRAASQQILDINSALTAYKREDITEDQLNAVFAVNRWNPAERDLIKGLAFAPPSYQQAYAGYIQQQFLQRTGFVASTIADVPTPIALAGKADGLSEEAIVQQWMATFNTLPIGVWTQAFFRGLAPLDALNSALRRDRVPDEWWGIWTDSQRPLIPFRTIPGMIAAGIMSESEGLDYLQKHGYSLQDAVRLLQYATRQSKASKATTAAAQHDISLTQAKTAYQDGILTSDQYLALLKAHGLNDSAAALEVDLVNIAEETKARKQIGIDIVNEYQAGLIDEQGALQQLAASGYTIAEQAAVAKKIKSTGAIKAKLPSEAELRTMTKHGVIDPDEYQNVLVQLGYLPLWAQRFRDLYFPIDGLSPA